MSEMIDLAKRSLERAEEAGMGRDATRLDHLHTGILAAEIAIAEALTCDGTKDDPGCACECTWPHCLVESVECADCCDEPEEEWEPDLCPDDCEFCRAEAEDWCEADLGSVPLAYCPDSRDELLRDPAVRVLIRWGIAG